MASANGIMVKTEVDSGHGPHSFKGIESVKADKEDKAVSPCLTGLPHELQVQIVEKLQRLKDVLRVALTCQLLHSIAVPILYHDVTVGIGGPQDPQVQRIFSPTNPGIKHVKHLTLRVEEELSRRIYLQKKAAESPYDPDEKVTDLSGFHHSRSQAQVMLSIVLELLPRDQLQSFNWTTWDPLTVDNWMRLYTSQRRIEGVELAPVDRPLLPAIQKDPTIFQKLEHATCLYLWPNDVDTLKVAQVALENLPKVDNFLLNCSLLKNEPEVSGPMEDSSTTPGFIFRTIFKHLSPFEKCTPIPLRDFQITHYDLHNASISILKVIDFTALQSLILDECAGAANCFAEMGKSYARPANLKRLCWIETNTDRHAVKTLEEFLESFKGLQILHVDIAPHAALLKPLVIKNHGDSLLSLFVRYEAQGVTGTKYTSSQLDEICERCQKLRQLSLPFQGLYAHAGWPYSNSEDIQAQIVATRKLPELEALCIQDWPATNVASEDLSKQDSVSYYGHQLSWLATRLFRGADAHVKKAGTGSWSKLSRIAFGVGPMSYYHGSETPKLDQMVFMRGQQVDHFGIKSEIAVLVEKEGFRETGEDESIIGWDSGPVFKELTAISDMG